jgi:hypothetical protein
MENSKPNKEFSLFDDLKARPEDLDIEIGGTIEMKPSDLMQTFDIGPLKEAVTQHQANIAMYLEGIEEEEKQIEFLETLIAAEEERQRLQREEAE